MTDGWCIEYIVRINYICVKIKYIWKLICEKGQSIAGTSDLLVPL